MKTLAIKFAAPVLMAAFFTSATVKVAEAGVPVNPVETVVPMTFNRIVVSGKVTVLITQRTKENIVADRLYDKTKISITRKGYTLMISSAESEPITINVSVKDLQRIDASGNALVKTSGNLNVQHLQVFLKDEARALVKANTESLYTYMTGHADLKVSGSTKEHFITKDDLSRLNMDHLAAAKITRDSIRTEAVAVILKGK